MGEIVARSDGHRYYVGEYLNGQPVEIDLTTLFADRANDFLSVEEIENFFKFNFDPSGPTVSINYAQPDSYNYGKPIQYKPKQVTNKSIAKFENFLSK